MLFREMPLTNGKLPKILFCITSVQFSVDILVAKKFHKKAPRDTIF